MKKDRDKTKEQLITELADLRRQINELEALKIETEQSAVAYQESGDKFSKAFNSSPDVIIISRLSDGKILEVNDAWESLFGYSREEVLGNSLLAPNLLSPLDRQRAVSLLEKQGFVREFELDVKQKSGDVRHVSLSLERIEIGGEQCLLTTIHDHTERKRAEEALKVSEERYRRLAENARDIIFRYRNLPSLGFDYISPAVLRIFGYAPEEFYADPLLIFKIIHPDSRSLLEEITSRPQDYLDKPVVLRWVRKDGEIIWTDQRSVPIYDKEGKVTAIEGIMRDITERKRTQEALEASVENFRNSLDDSSLGIRIVDKNGNTLYANRAMLDIYGYESIDKLNTIRTRERYTPESYAEHVLRREKRRHGEPVPSEYEISIVRKDTAIRYLQVFRKEVLWDGKTQYQVIYNDITEQKHAQEALRISEENYRNSIDTSPMGVLVFTRDAEIIYANRAILDIYGYSSLEEMRKIPIKERYTPENYAEYLVRSAKFNSGEVTSLGYELSIRRKDGGIRRLQAFRKEIIWGGEKQFQLLYNDITERKQAEEKLIEGERKLRSVFSSAPVGIGMILDRLIKELNDRLCEMTGYSREELLEKNVRLFHSSDADYESTREKIYGEITEKGSSSIETHWRRKDGTVIDVLINAVSLGLQPPSQGMTFTSLDITERKQAEELFRILAINSPISIYIVQKGKFVYTNPHFRKDSGYSEDELSGMESLNLVVPEDKEIVRENAVQMLKGKRITPYEFRIIKKNGEIRWASEVVASIQHQGERATIGSYQDVTEHKKVEEEHQKLAILESVGTLAGGIAHDFNNLLTGILGNIQLAEGYLKQDRKDTAQEMLSEAEKASFRARDLTQQLLTFSKGGLPVKKVMAVNKLLRDTATFALRGSSVKPEFAIPDNLWAVDADEGQINQVISNLVINADQAMPNGGVITISARNVLNNQQRSLPLPEGNYIEINIKDQGIGIPQAYQDKIFDPYFTTKQKGSGLGLASSLSIIKNHGGTITFESEMGKGTTFHVYLPATQEEVKEEEPDVVVTQSKPVATGRILVMDDEGVILMLLNRMLTGAGYEVVQTKNGAEAIQQYREAKESGKPIDAVILDLTVPGGMGGKETMVKLLEIDPKVKAIVSSGYANDPIMADYKKYGFSGVVTKPYDIKQMQETLRKVLAGK